MMKRCISMILLFTLMVQISTSGFAQSSPQNEIITLQQCMDKKFGQLQEELSKVSKEPILIDGKFRLLYSKIILTEILIGFDKRASQVKYTGMGFALASSATAYLAYRLFKDKMIFQNNLIDLEKKFKVMKYDGKLIAEFGGEESMQIQKDLMKKMVKSRTIFSSVFGVFALFAGSIAYACYESVIQNASAYQDAEFDINTLLVTTSEHEFNKILASNDPFISNLRKFSVETCQLISPGEIAVLLKDTLEMTQQQQNESLRFIQDTLDSIPQE